MDDVPPGQRSPWQRVRETGVDIQTHSAQAWTNYVAEFIVGPRDMHHVLDVLFDRTNADETQRAVACFNELLDEFEKEGYAVYRVNTRFQERVARSYGPVKLDVEHAIKRALDPKNSGAQSLGHRSTHLLIVDDTERNGGDAPESNLHASQAEIFDFQVLLQAILATFASDATLLDTPERRDFG